MKYRKKPVVIEAYQFTKVNYHREKMPLWLKEATNNCEIMLFSQYGGDVMGGEIKTLEGTMQISENDFIIKGVSGEFYPVKEEIFLKTYEPVEDEYEETDLCSS
jgi:hypothetical protein